MKPTQLVQLLNSSSLGPVIIERQLYRHRSRAGLRIGDGKTIDLLRYVAWLRLEIDSREQKIADDAARPKMGAYEAHRERQAARVLEMSQSARDIGDIPPIRDPERRAAAERDFRAFCETYFPAMFNLEWSDDHLKVIRKIEVSVLEGGLFAMAMPRGSGKTCLCETACLWAIIYGHREFVALIGADAGHSQKMLESMVSSLEMNDLLHDDFPEVCYPIRRLEGIRQRAAGQLYRGQTTQIGITVTELVLPTIEGSRASGSIVQTAGITGRIRGMKHQRADGSVIRPSLVLVDDPQTEESAWSVHQCKYRERIISGAVLGLSGPGSKISGLITLTIVRIDDMADRLLNRDKHMAWHGERTKMVYAFPTNEALWNEYREMRQHAQKHDLSLQPANDFYAANREAMDEGAQIAWPARFNADELSAIQHAMNLRMDLKDHSFFAEYQNEPLAESAASDELMKAEEIARKINSYPRGVVPATATSLTMFIDVQGKALYWLAVAWEENFTGYIVDYGTEPDQHSDNFTLRDLEKTLQLAAPNAGQEGQIYAGLERLCEATVGREWPCDDGAAMRVDRCLIDANWGASTDVVKQFCRQSRFAGVVMPSHGRFVGASSMPFADYKTKRGDRVGLNWRVPMQPTRNVVRHVLFDTNFWKTFVHARLSVAMGDPGCLSLFGASKGPRPPSHLLLADHLTAEYRVRTEGRGRTVDEWKLQPGRDNHWFDCLVGSAVAAAMHGAALDGVGVVQKFAAKSEKRYRSFAQMQAEARARQQNRGTPRA